MRKPISILLWVVLAVALVMLPAPACAGWGYSAVDVFSTTVVGTSTTYLDSWEFYDGNHPYVEGTLMREWETLGSNYQFNEYDSFVSVQVYASLEPGNAMYYMDGVHEAGMDVWNLYYVGSTYCGYYYFDPAAYPPYIYGISPNVGVSGTSGYIPIYGAYLAPQGTSPVVSMDGATLWIVYQSDNQINVYYSYVSLGTHNLTVTTIYGQSNAVQFTALAGDSTPYISIISPGEWEAGVTTDFSIAGTGFGTNPGLTIDGGWIEAYGVYSAWDTGMNAWVRVSSGSPDQTVTVSVTSNGSWGNSFMEQYPNQPRSGSKNAQVHGTAVPPTSVELVSVNATDPSAVVIAYRVLPAGATLDSAQFNSPGSAPQNKGSVSGAFTFSFNQNSMQEGASGSLVLTAQAGGAAVTPVSCSVVRGSNVPLTPAATSVVWVSMGDWPLLPFGVTHVLTETMGTIGYCITPTSGSRTSVATQSDVSIATPEYIEGVDTHISLWSELHWYNSNAGDCCSQSMSPSGETLPPQGDHFRSRVSTGPVWFAPYSGQRGVAWVELLKLGDLWPFTMAPRDVQRSMP